MVGNTNLLMIDYTNPAIFSLSLLSENAHISAVISQIKQFIMICTVGGRYNMICRGIWLSWWQSGRCTWSAQAFGWPCNLTISYWCCRVGVRVEDGEASVPAVQVTWAAIYRGPYIYDARINGHHLSMHNQMSIPRVQRSHRFCAADRDLDSILIFKGSVSGFVNPM